MIKISVLEKNFWSFILFLLPEYVLQFLGELNLIISIVT